MDLGVEKGIEGIKVENYIGIFVLFIVKFFGTEFGTCRCLKIRDGWIGNWGKLGFIVFGEKWDLREVERFFRGF